MKKVTKQVVEEREPSYRDEVALLLEQLDFSPDNVLAASSEQPGLFLQAIDYRMKAMRSNSQAKMALELSEADVSSSLRKEAKAIGDKTTESALSEQVMLNKSIQVLSKQKRDAEEQDEFAKLLLEAFRMRRDCLRIVGDLAKSEMATKAYFDESEDKLRRTKEQLKQKYPGSTL
jgi:hypothetical protein